MNPLNYHLAELKKVIVSVIALGLAAAALFTQIEPGFSTACIALVGPVFGVVGVFAAKHHSADDLQKALEQAKAAAMGVIGYFVTVPASTTSRITFLIVAASSVVGVYWAKRN